MSYRDDHDAALARADALAVELDAAQRAHDRDARALRDAKAQLDRDRARMAELEAKLAVPPPRPPPPRPPPRPPPPRPPAPPADTSRPVTLVASKLWYVDALIYLSVLVVLAAAFVVTHPDITRATHEPSPVDRAQMQPVANELERARVIATALWPDADLAGFKAVDVDASGSRDVSGSGGGYAFRSVSHPDACIHLGSTGGHFEHAPADASCPSPRPGRVQCNVVDIWQRARHDGASPTAVATIQLTASNGARVWLFRQPHVERTYLDDCL